jgi:hypothetical protein
MIKAIHIKYLNLVYDSLFVGVDPRVYPKQLALLNNQTIKVLTSQILIIKTGHCPVSTAKFK